MGFKYGAGVFVTKEGFIAKYGGDYGYYSGLVKGGLTEEK